TKEESTDPAAPVQDNQWTGRAGWQKQQAERLSDIEESTEQPSVVPYKRYSRFTCRPHPSTQSDRRAGHTGGRHACLLLFKSEGIRIRTRRFHRNQACA